MVGVKASCRRREDKQGRDEAGVETIKEGAVQGICAAREREKWISRTRTKVARWDREIVSRSGRNLEKRTIME